MVRLFALPRTIRALAVFVAIAAILAATPPAVAADITPEMKREIERIVRDYIDENPEIMVNAIHKLRDRDAQRRQQQGKAAIESHKEQLLNAKMSPTVGNPKGDVTIVEFFDYRCSFCKKMLPLTEKLLKEDGNIRHVYKEFPILGPASLYASRAALAVWKMDPGKYRALHEALMESRGDLTEERVLAIAEDQGIKEADLKEAMQAPEVQKEIDQNMELAADLSITGTPSYLIGDNVVPGAISFDDLKSLIAETRAAQKRK